MYIKTTIWHLLDVLPSAGSSSTINRTCAPPSDDINIDDRRSFNWRGLSNASDNDKSMSSVTLVLRLCRCEFGGSSSIKPLAHNGHVYSYTKQYCYLSSFLECFKVLFTTAQNLSPNSQKCRVCEKKVLTADTRSISTLHLWQKNFADACATILSAIFPSKDGSKPAYD